MQAEKSILGLELVKDKIGPLQKWSFDLFWFWPPRYLNSKSEQKSAQQMVLTDLWAEIICGGIGKMLPTQSSSTDVNCPLLQSEQKVEVKKVEVWMRRDRFMRLKLSLRLPPDTQCSPRISIVHIIPVRTNFSWGAPMTIHVRETNLKLQLCIFSMNSDACPISNVKQWHWRWVPRRTTRQTSGFHPSSAIQNGKLSTKRAISKLLNFIRVTQLKADIEQ